MMITTRLPPSDAQSFSLISYNILAQVYFDQNPYPYVGIETNSWENRKLLLEQQFREHLVADIICLQEVQFDHFRTFLEPLFSSMGFGCILQDSSTRAKTQMTGNATFFRASKFVLEWSEHRSRSLIIGLKTTSAPDFTLAVANCHLEGDPYLFKQRLSQIESVVKHLSRHPSQCRVVCGDFNSNESDNVCEYLFAGSHGIGFTSSFSNDLIGKIYYATYVNPGNQSRLDHVFMSPELSMTHLLNPLGDPQILDAVISGRIPNNLWPSDHIAVGVSLNFSFPPSNSQSNARDDLTKSPELDLPTLWNFSPLTGEERETWENLMLTAPEKPVAKPSKEEIENMKRHAEQVNEFVNKLEKDKKEFLTKVRQLQKASSRKK